MTSQLSQSKYSKTISAAHHSKKNKFLSKKFNFKTEKKDDDRKINSKFRRMFDHFGIILSSYGVCINRNQPKITLDNCEIKVPKKNEKKFSYFVGNGNNKNLIVSILKKRWWWAEAEDISSANFVWTQLKIGSVLQKQSSMMYSDLKEAEPNLYIKNIQ